MGRSVDQVVRGQCLADPVDPLRDLRAFGRYADPHLAHRLMAPRLGRPHHGDRHTRSMGGRWSRRSLRDLVDDHRAARWLRSAHCGSRNHRAAELVGCAHAARTRPGNRDRVPAHRSHQLRARRRRGGPRARDDPSRRATASGGPRARTDRGERAGARRGRVHPAAAGGRSGPQRRGRVHGLHHRGGVGLGRDAGLPDLDPPARAGVRLGLPDRAGAEPLVGHRLHHPGGRRVRRLVAQRRPADAGRARGRRRGLGGGAGVPRRDDSAGGGRRRVRHRDVVLRLQGRDRYGVPRRVEPGAATTPSPSC